MASYKYEAVNGAGERVSGVCRAADKSSAVKHCHSEGLYLIKLSLEGGGLFRKRRVMAADLRILLFKRLSFLLKSGINLKESMAICQSGQTKQEMACFLQSVSADLENGRTLSDAFQNQNIPAEICCMVQCGEESGSLAEVLADIAAFEEKRENVRQSLGQAMLYPLIVFTVGLGSFLFILLYVFPVIYNTARDAGGTAASPVLGILLALHDLLAGNLVKLSIGLALAIYFLKIIVGRLQSSGALLKLPIIRKHFIFEEVVVAARFGSVMLRSGMKLEKVLRLLAEMTRYKEFRELWQSAGRKIAGGSLLSQTLEGKAFLNNLQNYIAAGESTGQLDAMLYDASLYYEAEMERGTRYFLRMAEPCLLIITGIFVILLVMAIVLPNFALMDKIIL